VKHAVFLILIVYILVAGCINPVKLPVNTTTTPTLATTAVPFTSAPVTTQIPVNITATVAAVETPFITIDPIGNHSIGDVFFINGTTNLPVGENLSMTITELYANNHTEAQFAPEYPNGNEFFDIINNIPITSVASGTSGTNYWSENVTDIFKGIDSDNYSIGVFPSDVNISKDFRDPNNPNTNSKPELPYAFFYLTPASAPFITIDPIGNHNIGDVFFINGTTNLPATDIILISIWKSSFDPSGEGSYFQSNVTINQGKNGVNFWSCNTTPNLWVTFLGPGGGSTTSIADFKPDEYAAIVRSTDDNVSQSQLFTIFAAATNANATLLG
jgi:hypothetical protein